MIYYRRHGIITRQVRDGFVYTITHERLRFPILSEMPEANERRATDKAKEFIDEHLAESEALA